MILGAFSRLSVDSASAYSEHTADLQLRNGANLIGKNNKLCSLLVWVIKDLQILFLLLGLPSDVSQEICCLCDCIKTIKDFVRY